MDDELLKLIRELADELENEIRDRYSDGNYSIHHAYQRRFERDMITVYKARKVIEMYTGEQDG